MIRILIISGLVLLVLLIASIPKYLNDLHAVKKKLSSYMTKTCSTPVVPIEYYRTGEGHPILVSHGITGGFDQGLGLAEMYIGGAYDIIAVSRFGYLGSPIPADSSPEAQAEVYKSLLDELGIEKTYIFGNSAGSNSAVKFALKYPERCKGLILVSSIAPTSEKVALPPKSIMKIVFGSNFIYWLSTGLAKDNMLVAGGVTKTLQKGMTRQEKDELFEGTIKAALPVELRTKGIINDLYVSNPDINNGYEFEKMKVPVLMIHAHDDSLCNYKSALEVSSRIPDVEFVDFEKGGHIILGHSKEIQAKIADFVNSKG